MSNTNTQQRKPKFSVVVTTPQYQKLIHDTLQDKKKAEKFIAGITSAVAVNPALQECDAGSILAGALLGNSLNLSPSPQLGHYYLVPFNKKIKKNDGSVETIKVANFILGYKGYKQLAMRSGQYKKINVISIKKGEFVRYDLLEEEIEVNLIQDELERENTETIGYYAMFELLNGYRKTMYWTKEKMQNHADRYSQAYKLESDIKLKSGKIPEREMWKYSSFWYVDFDTMAHKTMIRQLLSQWGILSIEMQEALIADKNTDDTEKTVDDSNILPEVPIIPALGNESEKESKDEETNSTDNVNNPNEIQQELSWDDI